MLIRFMTFFFVLWGCSPSMSFGLLLAADLVVPGDFPTIQAAIDVASDGDRVLVAEGIYNERIDLLGKSIEVLGEQGPEVTVINGGGSAGYVVSFLGCDPIETVFAGFSVTGGFGSNAAGPGGGVRVAGGGATLVNCIILENLGVLGGGIHISQGNVTLRSVRIKENVALQGGGLYCELSYLTIRDTDFLNNEATQFGGAAAVNWLSTFDAQRSRFENNNAQSFGGAIYANLATFLAHDLTISDNGRVQQSGFNSLTVSPLGGGGIYTTSCNGRITSSRIARNNATFGTGIYVAQSGNLQLVNALISDNGKACECGQGAVYCNSSSPTLINCTIAGNGGFVGIFTTFNSFPVVRNSIIAKAVNSLNSQSPTAGNGSAQLSYCLLQGQPFAASIGDGNIVQNNSVLLDPTADYAPLPGSPAIDAGDNLAVPSDITRDLLGNLRFFDDPNTADSGIGIGPIVDLGAIEFGSNSGQSPIKPRHFQRGGVTSKANGLRGLRN